MQIYFAIPPNSAFHGLLEEFFFLYQRYKISNTLAINLLGNAQHFRTVPKYGDEFKGVCIGFDTSLLFERVGGGGEVQYVEELPIIDFVKDDFKSRHVKNIYYKEIKWSFEKEYRLHKMWQHNVTNDERNIELPTNCIVKIILGEKMPLQDREEIKQIARINYPNAEIIENH